MCYKYVRHKPLPNNNKQQQRECAININSKRTNESDGAAAIASCSKMHGKSAGINNSSREQTAEATTTTVIEQ